MHSKNGPLKRMLPESLGSERLGLDIEGHLGIGDRHIDDIEHFVAQAKTHLELLIGRERIQLNEPAQLQGAADGDVRAGVVRAV